MKRVLIITYYWPPSGGAGVQRWLKFSKYLPSNGWQPVVYTPSNPEAPAIDDTLGKDIPAECEVITQPISEPYSFYKRFTGRGKDEKVNAGFLDEGRKPGLKDKIAVWIRGNLFIPDARRFWIRPSVKYLSYYLKAHPVDVIVSTGPPHSMHLIGLGLKKKLNIPWVADFRDPWTGIDFYNQLRLTRYADRRHHRMERKVLQSADRVVTIGWESARQLETLGGRSVDVITNGYDPDDISDSGVAVDKDPGKFVIRHVGAMNSDRNHENFWQAIKHLKDDGSFSKELSVELIGKNDAAVRESVERNGLMDIVSFVPYVPHEEIGGLLRSADLLYLPVNNTPNAKAILTGKLFEYIASGTPVLGIGPKDGDAARVLKDTQSGEMVDFSDSYESIIMTFGKYYHFAKVINNSWSCVRAFSRNELAKKMCSIFDKEYIEA